MKYFISEPTGSIFRNNNGQIQWKALDRANTFDDGDNKDADFWGYCDEELVGDERMENGQTLSEHYRVIEKLIGGKI